MSVTDTERPAVPLTRGCGDDRGRPDDQEAVSQVLPVLAEHARDVDEKARFPVESLAALRGSGLMGLLVPVRYGGMGGDLADVSRIARVLAGECMASAVIWSMHCQQVAAVAEHGSPRLRDRVLPGLAAGRTYLGSVTTERGKGGHLLSAQAPLLPLDGNPGHWRLERDAPISTGALHADAFLMTMRAGPDAVPTDVRLVWADRAALAMETRSDWNPMGMRGTHSVAVSLRGDVRDDDIVGADFRTVALETFVPAGHVAWASCWLGAAQGALRRTVALLRDPAGRRQFDLDSTLFTSRLARIRMDLDLVEACLDRVLAVHAQGRRPGGPDLQGPSFQILVNELKVAAAERCLAAVDQLIELVGLRHGYLKSSPTRLEQIYRDLRSASLMYANDRLLTVNGKLALLDRAATLP